MHSPSLPLVSVCMASFNHAPFVAEAVNSVLDQTFTDFELIIIDDGSSDGSDQILLGFQDPRIRLSLSSRNLTACVAANQAVEMARGRYIAAISSDDVWEPEKLQQQVGLLEANPNVLATFSCASIIDQASRLIDASENPMDPVAQFYSNVFNVQNRSSREWLEHFFLNGNCLCHSSILIRSASLREIGPYNTALCQLPDFDLWIRLVQSGDIFINSERLVRFRVLAGNKNASGLGRKKSRTMAENVFVYSQFFEITDPMNLERLIQAMVKFDQAGQSKEFGQAATGVTLAKWSSVWHPVKAVRIAALNFLRQTCTRETEPSSILVLHSSELNNDSYNIEELDRASVGGQPLWKEVQILTEETRRLQQIQHHLETELAKHRHVAQHYQQLATELMNSRVWRLSAPLRHVIDTIKRPRFHRCGAPLPQIRHQIGSAKDQEDSESSRHSTSPFHSPLMRQQVVGLARRMARKVRSLSMRYVYPTYPALHSLLFFQFRRRLIAFLSLPHSKRLRSFPNIFFRDLEYSAKAEYRPLVSIVVPCFNHEKFIQQRLDSILAQTYTHYELILLDDASSDRSAEFLRSFSESHPDRTQLILNTTNSGSPFCQWKRGLTAARGELIWIAETDDFCEPSFLETLVPSFFNQGVMLAFCQTAFVASDGVDEVWSMAQYIPELSARTWTKSFTSSVASLVSTIWSRRNLIPNVSAALFRKPHQLALLDDPQWQSMRVCGDWWFYLEISRGGLVAYSAATVNYYRQHGNNSSVALHRQHSYLLEHLVLAEQSLRLFPLNGQVCTALRAELRARWCDRQSDPIPVSIEERIASLQPADGSGRSLNLMVVTYALIPGGGEIMPLRLANSLKKRGHSVSVLNCRQQPTVPVIREMLRSDIPLFELSSLEALSRLIDDLSIDVIHSHHPWVDTTIAELLQGNPCVAHVITSHGMYDELDIHRLNCAARLFSGRINQATYVADRNRDALIALGLNPAQIHKIPNAIDQHIIQPLPRTKLGIPDHAFLVCIASRAIREKGWQEACEAVLLARQQTERDIHLLVIGAGREQERLKTVYSCEQIHFLGFRGNIRDFYGCADLGILPTFYPGESQPLSLIECLSAGRPFLASDIGEIKEMLTASDGLAGFAIPLMNSTIPVKDFAKAITLLADDPDLHAKLCSLAREAALKFDASIMAESFESVYVQARYPQLNVMNSIGPSSEGLRAVLT